MTATYPKTPGFKTSEPETSRAAAQAIEPKSITLRNRVLELLNKEALTADEAAKRLDETPFSIRPRLSELSQMELIWDTNKRRPNASGRPAVVWAGNKLKFQQQQLI